ncbi:MAG: flavodoxin family protein [Oscillospiraceae bacterium]|nr:flavodoxin family protein [Oscillospiraceae bacterium]
MGVKIVAINAGPRKKMNTDTLVSEAARGAESMGAEVTYFDLFRLEKYTGCVSCFGCMRAPNEGRCVCKDGLSPVLEAIREADGVIIGSPNYLSNLTASFRALYERLFFQSLTYNSEKPFYNPADKQVVLISTSNAPEDIYRTMGYDKMIEGYKRGFEMRVGPTQTLIAGNTLQVPDYSKYNWKNFDPRAKKRFHDEDFPKKKEEAFKLGVRMVERING